MQRNIDNRKPEGGPKTDGSRTKPEERRKNQTPKTLRTKPEGTKKNQTPKGESAIERVPSPTQAPNGLEEEIKEKEENVSPESVNQQLQELKGQMMKELKGQMMQELESVKEKHAKEISSMETKVIGLQHELESVKASRSSCGSSERGSENRVKDGLARSNSSHLGNFDRDSEYSSSRMLSRSSLLKLSKLQAEEECEKEKSIGIPYYKGSRRADSEMRQFKQPKRIYNSPSDSSPSSSAHSEESESSSNSSTVGDFENETIYMPKTPKRRTEVQKRGKLKYHHEDNLFRRMSVENLVRGDKILRITSDKYMDIKWSDLSVNGYLIFLQQVEQFSLKNQQHVKYLLPLVEDRLMESVMSEIQLYFPREYRTRRDMLQISVEHLTAVVQLMLVPNSRQHFLLQLKRSCKDCGVEQGSFESYKSVKSKLCGLRTKFLDRYDFLKDACELAGRRNCIPYNTFKDGGVLWTWMDLTPVKARNNFKLDLSHRHWDDLRGFLKDFFKIVDKTARQAEAALA